MAQSLVSYHVIDGSSNANANSNHDRGRSPPLSQARHGGKLSRRQTEGHSSGHGITAFLTRKPVAQSPVPQQQLDSRYNMSDERLLRQDRPPGDSQPNGTQRMDSTDGRNRPFPQASSNHEHEPTGVAASRHTYRQGLWSFVEQLPQPADDQTVKDAAQVVFSLADQYVDNFYVNRLRKSICVDAKFQDLHFPNLPAGSAAATVIQLVTDPTVVIKHCLVHVLLSCIAFDNDGHQLPSFLPPEFTALARALRGHEIPVQHYSALSAYRVLLSFLRPGIFDDESFNRLLDQSFGKIWNLFEITFQPWLDLDHTKAERNPPFEALLEKTVRLGITLFSHPCTFMFNWDLKRSTSRDCEIVIAPRLLKINDEEARELNRSQLMLNITTRRTLEIENMDSQNYAQPDTQPFHDQVTHSEPAQNSGQFAPGVNNELRHPQDRAISQLEPMSARAAPEPIYHASGQGPPATPSIYELDSDPQRRCELEVGDPNSRQNNSNTAYSLPIGMMPPSIKTSAVDNSLHGGDGHVRYDLSSQSSTHANEPSSPNGVPSYIDPIGSYSPPANQPSQGNLDQHREARDRRKGQTTCPPTLPATRFPTGSAESQPGRRKSSRDRRSASADRNHNNNDNLAPPSAGRRRSISTDRDLVQQFKDTVVIAFDRPKHSGTNPPGMLDNRPEKQKYSGIPRGVLPDRTGDLSRQESKSRYGQYKQSNEPTGPIVIGLTPYPGSGAGAPSYEGSGAGGPPDKHEQRHHSGSRHGFGDRTFRDGKKRNWIATKLRL